MPNRIIRSKTMRVHYLVGNLYECCGHRHNNMITALTCMQQLNKRMDRICLSPEKKLLRAIFNEDHATSRYSVYCITYSRRKNYWARNAERIA